MHQNEVTSFVAGKLDGTANVGTGLENIKKGDVFIINADSGEILSGGANTVDTAPAIAFVSCKKDGYPIVSGTVYGKKLRSGAKTDYVAAALKKMSFSVPVVTEETEFPGVVVLKSDLRLHPNKQDRIDFTAVSSTGGFDGATKVAADINRPVDNNPKLAGEGYVKAIVTQSGGTLANIGTAATATVSNGSDSVTFSAVHGLAVADYVYFPGGGVYSVAEVLSTTKIKLNAPYIGASEVIAADTAKEVSNPTGFGVEVEALPIVRTNPVDQYHQTDFEIGLDEVYENEAIVAQAYSPGKGIGWEVRDQEVACMGWQGYTDRRDTMRAEFPFSIDPDLNYDTISISSNAPVRGDLQQEQVGPQSVFMAFGEANTTQLAALLVILTPWAASGGIDIS